LNKITIHAREDSLNLQMDTSCFTTLHKYMQNFYGIVLLKTDCEKWTGNRNLVDSMNLFITAITK